MRSPAVRLLFVVIIVALVEIMVLLGFGGSIGSVELFLMFILGVAAAIAGYWWTKRRIS
jgi:hypothetical protein